MAMNETDMRNASYYYEMYMLDYLLRNKYITQEEYDRIVQNCKAESGMFFVSKVINLAV